MKDTSGSYLDLKPVPVSLIIVHVVLREEAYIYSEKFFANLKYILVGDDPPCKSPFKELDWEEMSE